MTPSILPAIYDWAAREPDHRLYTFLDGDGRVTESYTYAQFLQRTADIAAHIRRVSSLRRGDRVLLAYPPGIEMICSFFACVRSGLIPVPVYPPAGSGFQVALQKIDFIAKDCDAAAALTTRSFYWSKKVNETRAAVATFSLSRSPASRLPWIVTTEAEPGTGSDQSDVHSDVLFLQYTSGSTTAPRGVIVTHDNLLNNCDVVVDHRPVGVSWLPQYHDMGLIGYYLFFSMKGGTTYGFSPLDFIRRPALWLETISKYRGTASSAPNFAYEYCLRPDKITDAVVEGLDLSSLRFLMTAAEPVRAHVCREFLKRFGTRGLDPRSFFAAYGLAEFTLAVSNYGRSIVRFDTEQLRRKQATPAPREAAGSGTTTLVSCGQPLATTEIRIVDTSAEPRALGAREVGEIWLGGPSKCAGYWNRPDLSAAVFEASLPFEPGRTWLRTGDMGFLHEGELYVCGRSKDMLIVRGLNFYPQDIEAVVESDAWIRKGCVAAFAAENEGAETVVVVAEVKNRRALPDARSLNRSLLKAVGITAATFVWIAPRTIPKTSSGKIPRHLVRQRWLDGALTVIDVAEGAVDAFEPATGSSRAWLTPFALTGDETGTLVDAGLDSLRLTEFAAALEVQLEAHGSHDLSGAIDTRILQRIAICELVELVDQVVAAAPHARLRLSCALADLGREHRASEAELMRRDARLHPEIVPLRGRDGCSVVPDAAGGVLLTGATGFFGPFLLTSLLHQLPNDIHVLMRPGADATQRIGASLRSIAADERVLPEGWERRVRPVYGDLAMPRFGLNDAAWQGLADSVSTIYHNGATVNYLLDYAAMREVNVLGTNEVVRLAVARQQKVINYISTTFVFGWSVQETLFETDMNAGMERLDFGYSQSKWVAERVMMDAMRQGVAARIFRPALLTPSLHGGGSNFDITIRLLAFMLRHGITTTAQNQVSFTPADFAADNIVAISRVPDSVGATLHVTRDEYARLDDISTILGTLTGREFRAFALPEFVPEVIERCRPGDILFPLLNFLVRSVDNISAMEFKRYDNSTFRKFRDASDGGRADPPLQDVVHGLLRFMYRHNLVEGIPMANAPQPEFTGNRK